MAGIPIQIGWVFTLKSKYFGTQWKLGDTFCHGSLKVVKVNYEPRKWWQLWKKRVIVGYNVQRIK